MAKSYLGKLVLNWCDECCTPVLGRKCSCGAETRQVQVTPPGDIRPAFQADIDHINEQYRQYFGVPLIPEGHIAVLNKIPDRDRMEEVVMGGAVVCAIRYLPEKKRWEVLPRIHSALYSKPARGYVVADNGAIESIKGGASLLAPGLVDIHPDVKEGDEIFVLDREGNCIGVGRSRVNAEDTVGMERGQIVRTRKAGQGICVPGESDWEKAVQSNSQILHNVETEGMNFVKSVTDKNPDLFTTVSFSGGKDSLATLLVVLKAIGNVPLLFSDTGLEFPETYENVKEVAKKYGLEIFETGAKDSFFEELKREGPPSVDARWCCSVCKLNPVREMIKENWGECLSFIGQRKYESLARMKSPRVWRNYKVQVQLSASPIQHWTALHVFLYLFQEKAPYNVLYERRIDRIGCYMCPSSDIATFELIKEKYPELWEEWNQVLEEYRANNNLPESWKENFEWRKRGEKDDTSSYS